MNPLSLAESQRFLRFYQKTAATFKIKKRDLWVAPPAVFLEPLIKRYKNFTFGAQNCFYQQNGAFTGEISPLMLKSLGVKFVILGHSERKKIGENLSTINKKITASLMAGLVTLLCFGELKRPRHLVEARREWERQYRQLLQPLSPKLASRLVLVFEPAWGISTEKQGWVPRQHCQAFIEWFKLRIMPQFKTLKLVYGGSVNSQVIKEFLGLPFIGYLIGANSFQRQEFKKILAAYYNNN